MKKLTILILFLVSACYCSGQVVANLSPRNIVYQYKPYKGRVSGMCTYELKNISSDTIATNASDVVNVYPRVVPPGQKFTIEWPVDEEQKKRTQKMGVPFESKGKPFNVTVSRTIDTSSKPLLLTTDDEVIKGLRIPYAQREDYVINWRIKNVSDMDVLCPTVIDVWSDAGGIYDKFTQKALLPAGKSRSVQIHVHYFFVDAPTLRSGQITTIGDKGGQRFVQILHLSVAGSTDKPLGADR